MCFTYLSSSSSSLSSSSSEPTTSITCISDYKTLPESLYPSEKNGQIIFGNHALDLPQLQPAPESESSKFMIIIYGINNSTRLIKKRKGIVDFNMAYSNGIGGEVLDNLKSWVGPKALRFASWSDHQKHQRIAYHHQTSDPNKTSIKQLIQMLMVETTTQMGAKGKDDNSNDNSEHNEEEDEEEDNDANESRASFHDWDSNSLTSNISHQPTNSNASGDPNNIPSTLTVGPPDSNSTPFNSDLAINTAVTNSANTLIPKVPLPVPVSCPS
ncbi:hypothetical protein BY996DRAFT_8392805 [Phakopsora pachyrhizi]|nr:hypothetical protein BY996DRAFT_8392805 [Phakopsora pachyrhizi]